MELHYCDQCGECVPRVYWNTAKTNVICVKCLLIELAKQIKSK